MFPSVMYVTCKKWPLTIYTKEWKSEATAFILIKSHKKLEVHNKNTPSVPLGCYVKLYNISTLPTLPNRTNFAIKEMKRIEANQSTLHRC